MATDFLLEIDGIKGESSDDKHKETIELESFSWGASNAGGHGSGGGGGAGKASFQDLHFTTPVNKASPLLMQACADGTHIKTASLFVRKAGGKQEDYYVVKMADLLVSSYQSGGHAGGNSIPTDQFALNFTKIEFDYKPQKPDGSLAAAIHGGWNVKENKKV
jgi:type VI secretion system secreted protein Hcp